MCDIHSLMVTRLEYFSLEGSRIWGNDGILKLESKIRPLRPNFLSYNDDEMTSVVKYELKRSQISEDK